MNKEKNVAFNKKTDYRFGMFYEHSTFCCNFNLYTGEDCMRKLTNDCGTRNTFGYFDARANEIVLKRPCYKKSDVSEAYSWIDSATDLKKFSIGIGAAETFVTDDFGDNLYGSARGVVRQSVMQSMAVDNEILRNILSRIGTKKTLTNLALKCFMFSENPVLFDQFLQTIKNLESLIYLDLSGCYFTDEQLLDLAEFISQSHIAHLIWPEPRMSDLVIEKVAERFRANHSLVVMRGVPLDFQKIAQDNREWLFALGRRPTMVGVKEAEILKEYAASVRLGIAFEKQRLFDLEKAVEAVLA